MTAPTADLARHPLRSFHGVPRAPKLVIFIEALLATSAIAAGVMMVLRPDGHLLGVTVELLQRSPFSDFHLPGLLLAAGVGGPNLIAMVLTLGRDDGARAASFVAGAAVTIFASVEVTMIPFNPQQPLVMALGAVLMALSVTPQKQGR